MLIERIEIGDLLSYRNATTIGAIGPVAALVGRNNVGKSNVFRAIGLFLKYHGHKSIDTSAELEKVWHGGDPTGPAHVSLRLKVAESEWPNTPQTGLPEFQPVIDSRLDFTPVAGSPNAQVHRTDPDANANDWTNFFVDIGGRVMILAPQRRTSNESPQMSGLAPGAAWDGQGFKAWLNHLDRGRSLAQQRRAREFREDVRKVAGLESLNIGVHAVEGTWLDVLVQDEGQFRASLEDCGTGVQTVILAISALHRRPGSVILLDDPEAHLHPAAQATFARVVAERATATGGQVVFATHSPAVLDTVPSDQVFELSLRDGATSVRQLAGGEGVLDSLRELGYRPSLLQMADAVLFVEGPTDQAAIRAWWKTLFGEEPEPRVALLPAGGDCMRHLDVDAIRALGRTCYALFDSDRRSAADEAKSVATEFQERMKDVATTHILARRELENYLAPKAIVSVQVPAGTGGIHGSSLNNLVSASMAGTPFFRVVDR